MKRLLAAAALAVVASCTPTATTTAAFAAGCPSLEAMIDRTDGAMQRTFVAAPERDRLAAALQEMAGRSLPFRPSAIVSFTVGDKTSVLFANGAEVCAMFVMPAERFRLLVEATVGKPA